MRTTPSAELSGLAGALLADPEALQSLDAPRSAREILDSLSARPDAVGAHARGYLDLVGYRIVAGYDPGEPYGHEVPHVMLACVRAALAARSPAVEARRSEEGRDLVSDLRRRAPAAKRARFDELIEEARSVSELRDDRVLYSDTWASGILRRAILEIGGRLERRGRIAHAPAAVDASFDELVALLRTGKGVTSETLAARTHRRQSRTVGDVPEYLGARPEPPPPVGRFPRRAREVEQAWAAALQSLVRDGNREQDVATVRGIGVSRGIAVGRVRYVRGSADLARIELGDVLVTATTSSAFNVFLPLLAAIVTDRGGALSHAAIVAREYGIPGVVGTRDATQRLPEGIRVRVDGGAGEVHLL